MCGKLKDILLKTLVWGPMRVFFGTSNSIVEMNILNLLLMTLHFKKYVAG